jgi:quercetin dioxygenase-like cupin family protein
MDDRFRATPSAKTAKEESMAKIRTTKERPPTKTGVRPTRAGHPVPGLVGPFLQFDLAAETEQLRHEDPWKSTSRNAKTLVKYPDLRIVLIAMKAGTRMEGHRTDESISVQALTGKLRLHLPEKAVELSVGGLLTLEGALPHDVEALEDSSFLLTISWSRGA